MRDYFLSKGWKCKKNTVILNGVDKKIFCEGNKFNNGKINILAHHWSDNHMKGAQIYEEIDRFVGEYSQEFTFTYIGRTKSNFKNTKVIQPLFGTKLGQELGKYDVYVSASKWDPGPNHISEPISCKIPTYVHFEGGGCVEFAGHDHVFHSWDELKQLLLGKHFLPNSTSFETWEEMSCKYKLFMNEVLNG
jgi:hypothetical protein